MSSDIKKLIKPLQWQQMAYSEGDVEFSATTPFGSYQVNYDATTREWSWRYYFTEYYDEGQERCRGERDGKRRAWNDWVSRIQPALKAQP